MKGGAIQTKAFQLAVGIEKNRTCRIFIYAAGFHAHQAVLHKIVNTDAVLCADFIQRIDQFHTVHFLPVDSNRFSFLKVDGDKFRLVGSIFGITGDKVHIFVGRIGGIFQIIPLMGEVPHVPVHGVRIFLRRFFFFRLLFIKFINRHVVRFCISHLIFTGFHIPQAPGSDNLHMRCQCLHSQFKTDLVISLAGGTVADGIRSVFLCHIHKTLADQRAGKRRS